MSFPDIEYALIEYLDDLGYCVTHTPLDLAEQLPVLRIQRVGGNDDAEANEDYPNVLIIAFCLKTTDAPRGAHVLSETVRDRMTAINDGGVYLTGQNCLLLHCHTINGPVELAYLDPKISVFQTSYRISTKGR